VFEDMESRVFNGRTGKMNYRYNGDLYSTDVAVDGRGTDVAAYKLKDNVIDLSVRDGADKKVLWEGKLGGPDRIPQLNTWLFPDGFMLPGDRCGDIVITGYVGRGSFYAVFDGGDGHILWSRWTGAQGDRPSFTERRDANRRC
jgi:hypothetical protein